MQQCHHIVLAAWRGTLPLACTMIMTISWRGLVRPSLSMGALTCLFAIPAMILTVSWRGLVRPSMSTGTLPFPCSTIMTISWRGLVRPSMSMGSLICLHAISAMMTTIPWRGLVRPSMSMGTLPLPCSVIMTFSCLSTSHSGHISALVDECR